MSSFGNALSFPAKLFAASDTNYQMFLKPLSVGNKVLCYTNDVAWQYSAGVCSALKVEGRRLGVVPIFSRGKKGADVTLTLERGAVSCLARGQGGLPLLWNNTRPLNVGCKGRVQK